MDDRNTVRSLSNQLDLLVKHKKYLYGIGWQRWEKVKLASSSILKLDQFLMTQAPLT
jgi:hypothetical protein